MPGSHFHRLTAVALVFAAAHMAAAGEIYSTMRNVNAVVEAHGFLLSPAPDSQPAPLPSDLSPAQAFEIVRPLDRPVTIGRLFTSCSCIQVESQKRVFAAGERAVLIMRNIRPTPPNGQVYAIFVQITSPVRTTLRYDTFVQSGSGPGPEPAAPGNAGTFEPPEVAPHPRIGGGARTPAVLVDDELERLGETGAEDAAEAAGDGEDDSQVIRELTRQAGQSSLDDLPQLAAIPPQIHRTPGTADVLDGMEENGAPDMTPRLDGEELEGYLAASEVSLSLPDGEDVRDSLGGARGDLENLYDREAGDPELDASVDAARQAVDGYVRRGGNPGDQGTADLAVAVDIDGDIPDFYAHMPPTPVPAAAPAVPEEAAATAAAPDGALPPADLAMAETSAAPRSPLAPPAAPAGSPAPSRNPDAPKPVQAVSLITVGVRDMPSSIRFYEALGWRRAAPNKYDQTAFFQLQGQILALYPMHEQLREQNMPEAAPAPGGITLALHVNDKADVWSVYQRFMDAGGTSLRAPVEMASGAVTSYVADPDGNPWEISYVPQFRIDEEGGLWLP